jgi:hypothetical protein
VGAGTDHWEVVSAVSEQEHWYRANEWRWIRIVNPFDNELEYYPWCYAFDSMWLQIPGTRRIVEMWHEVPFSGLIRP